MTFFMKIFFSFILVLYCDFMQCLLIKNYGEYFAYENNFGEEAFAENCFNYKFLSQTNQSEIINGFYKIQPNNNPNCIIYNILNINN